MTRNRPILRVLSRLWLVLWLLLVPLFHIHPEADHAHGSPNHQHGGTFHSVLSEDLDCEFHEHAIQHETLFGKDHHGHMGCDHSAGHHLNHDEIDFPLLKNSFDDPIANQHEPVVFLHTHSDQQTLGSLIIDQRLCSERSPPIRIHAFHPFIRPPPSFFA